MPKFSTVSRNRLSKAHPKLQELMEAAIVDAPIDFMITETLRTTARQAQLRAAGASKTSNSRHLTGHAVDVACLIGGKVAWDWPLYERLSAHIKAVAKRLGIDITWGGDWKTLRDGPHYELTWKSFPK